MIPRFLKIVLVWALEHRTGRPIEEILLFISGVEEFLLGSNVPGWEKGNHTVTLRRSLVTVE